MNPRSQSQPRPLPPRAVLIAQLHELARKLGRTPKFQETSKNYREYGVHHPIYFKQRFGSWTKALRAAHLPLNLSQEFTREELIAQLRNLSTHLGAKLTQNDVREARDRHTCAPVTAFTREFGTLHKALVAAGVNRPLATSESELIADLKELARKLGCSPGTSEIGRASKRGECRGPEVYAKRFGSVGRALRSAGLPPTNFPYTRHSLIKTLRELETQLGRLPTQRDIRQGSAEGDLPGASTFSRYFGGLKNALRLARLAPPKETLAQKKRRMAKELREVSLELGHAPFSDEWTTFNRQGKLASVSTYILYFGSLDDAREEAGVLELLPATRRYQRRQVTADDIVNYLRELARELGRAPRIYDIKGRYHQETAIGLWAIDKHFGTFTKAKIAAGLRINSATRAKHQTGPALMGTLRVYTDDELIADLQTMAARLGRMPKGNDVIEAVKRGEMATITTYRNRYGSLNKALSVAGFTPKVTRDVGRRYTRDELISALRRLARKLKRPPSFGDVRSASNRNECAEVTTYVKRFGGIRRARKAAGLPERVTPNRKKG